MDTYEKRGYLNSEFRIFHLSDTDSKEFAFHYHDFDKIIIFIRGDVDYIIEGKSYRLNPYDIVLVHHNDIHKPVIRSHAPYERIVVYISPNFIEAYKNDDYDLSYCFQKARQEHTGVLRIQSLEKSTLLKISKRLEHSFEDMEYASSLYRQILFIEFMIHLNRAALGNSVDYLDTGRCNQKIVNILKYINENLTEDIHVEELASQFFISKYYMMRLFKNETGLTIGSYVNQKRLLLARELILEGHPITDCCYQSGFKDYSTFSRAYKKQFHELPRQTQQGIEKR